MTLSRASIFICLVTALTIFRIIYILNGVYALAPDEAYFWEWSRHLDWSFYDMGPMVALIISGTTKLFGATELGVRIGAVLLAAGVSLVVYRLALEMFGSGIVAFSAGLLMHIVPIGAAGAVIMTYYSPQVFFWSLSLLFLHRAISSGRARWWYLLGAALGGGLLSHHMFFVFSAQILLYLVLSREGRPWLRRREPYIAAIIALDIFVPVLLWNINHDMVMFRHATGLMSRTRSAFDVFMEYLGGQLGIVSPLIFLGVLWALVSAVRRGIRGDDRWLFLACTSLPTLIFIGFLSLGRRVEANWPVSAYLSGFIALSAFYHLRTTTRAWPRIAARIAIALALLITVVAHYPPLLDPVWVLPPRMDTTNRLFGWRELGARLSEIRKDAPWTFLASLDYGISSEMSFYTAGTPHAYCIPVSRRFNQFDFFEDINREKGKDAVYVKFGPADIEPEIRALFESVSPPEHLSIPRAGVTPPMVRQVFSIFRCSGFKGIPGNTPGIPGSY